MPAGFIDGFFFAIWLTYIVIKDVIMPSIKAIRDRNKPQLPENCPLLGPIAERVAALEIGMAREKTRIAEFAKMLKSHEEANERTFVAIDNKLDIVLTELKEFRESIEERILRLSERVKGAEVHLEHLMERRRGGNGD